MIPSRMQSNSRSLFCFAARWVFLCLWLAGGFFLKAQPVTELKVMSFNIWVNGGSSLSDCIEAIRSSGADLVGLQECSSTTVQTIANELGFHFLAAGDCSIVSRFPIVNAYVSGNSRGVTVQLAPGQRAHLFNCHLAPYPYGPYELKNGQSQSAVLNLENTARMPALNQLLTTMQPVLDGPEPCFLVGDFNAPSHFDYADFPWPTSIACTNAGLGDSYFELHSGNRKFPPLFAYDEPGITWTPKTNQEPEGVFDRIDFVHYSKGDGATPIASSELDGRNSVNPWPSDHRAVLTTFTITPPVGSDKASLPVPANAATNLSLNVLLNWLPGTNATSHAVYFGTNSPGTLLTNTTAASVGVSNLLPGTTYFWRVDESTPDGVIPGDVWSFTTASPKLYEWNFANGDLSPALGHGILDYANSSTANQTSFGITDGAIVPHINGQPAKYLHAPAFTDSDDGYLVTLTASGPNGGGAYINQFTMIFDVLLPGSIGWFPLFNTNPGNANDADFYVDPNGALGIAVIGYSAAGSITANTWNRIAFAADLAASTVKYYLNGQLIFTGAAALDGRHSLYSNVDAGPDLLLFNEGDGSGVYTHEVYLSSFLLADRTFSDAEITALGGPNARGILVPAPAITLSITLDENNVILNWSGGSSAYQLQKTDAITNAWENVGSQTTATNATLPRESNSVFFRVIGTP